MPQNILPQLLSGQIKRYKGNGRLLGYPTANLDLEAPLRDGVYFGHAKLKEWTHQPAIIFIGVPSTMGDTSRRVEAYILDIPDTDYYGLELELSIEYFQRTNRKFSNVDELIAKMDMDVILAREWFKRN